MALTRTPTHSYCPLPSLGLITTPPWLQEQFTVGGPRAQSATGQAGRSVGVSCCVLVLPLQSEQSYIHFPGVEPRNKELRGRRLQFQPDKDRKRAIRCCFGPEEFHVTNAHSSQFPQSRIQNICSLGSPSTLETINPQ